MNLSILNFNNIDIFYINDENNTMWFRGIDIAKILGYSDPNRAISQHITNVYKLPYEKINKNLDNLVKLSYNEKNTNYINLDGVKILISKCRKNISNELLKFLNENLNINIPKYIRYECKESEILKYIEEAFQNIEIIYQFRCGNYRIDMVMPFYKIAIECDENNHNNRDIIYERNRELYIRTQGFSLIRFNPDDKHFSIFKVINQIIILVMKS